MIDAPTSLEVTTLGRFEIRRQQDTLSGGNWNRRKVCDLFKLLVSAERHRLHREQVQEILWPESASGQAASSFGKTLYLLRRALEPDLATGKGGASNYVTLDHDTVLLLPNSMRIDADIFETAVKQLQVKSRSARDLEREAIIPLLDEFDQLLNLYGGDYLPEDLYEDWAQRRRDRLRRIYCWLLETAAELAVTVRMGLRACEYLLALLERNPSDEQTHRQLMLVYARMGRRSDALNQFQVLSDALYEELNTKPLPETITLYHAIQSGRITVDLAELLQSGSPLRAAEYKSDSRTHVEQPDEHRNYQGLTTTPGEEQHHDYEQQQVPPIQRQINPERMLTVALVARDEEMQRLQQAYLQTCNGQRRVFVISGEAGIGKTRLVRDFTSIVRSKQRSTVLWGRCYEMSGSLPYQPIVEAIDSHVYTQDVKQLRHVAGNSAADLAKIVPGIHARLLDLPPPEPLGAEVERRNLYNAVARYFTTLAVGQPTIIILDDLQWADSSTMQLLSYLTSQSGFSATGATPFYILLYRADEVHEAHPLRGLLATLARHGNLDEVHLKRLDENGVRQLLINMAGHSVREPFSNEIYKYTEGNPFFVGETILSLLQEGKIKRVGERWQATVELEEMALPQNVRLLIERRLVQFSPECRTTLALAAVLGRQFSSALLCHARNLSEDVVAEHVDDAIRAHILQPLAPTDHSNDPGTYKHDADLIFTHDKIREVLYQWLNPLRRRSMHRQAAQAIETSYISRSALLQKYYSTLAYHYQMAEDYTRAVDYYQKAAEHAVNVYAFIDATTSIEKALDFLSGDEDRARRAELLHLLAEDIYLYTGRPDKAIEAGIAACTLWRSLGDVVKEAEVRLNVAFAFHWQGRESESMDYVMRALECLETQPGETRLLARAYVQWGLAATNAGDTIIAYMQLQRADELHAQISNNDPFISVVSLWARSWLAFLTDTAWQMLDYALRAAEVCRTTHRFGWEPMMTYSVAWAHMLLGHITEGEQVAYETLEKAQRHNAVGASGWAYLVLAFLAIQKAQWDNAEQFSAKAWEIATMLHDGDLQARVLWSRSVSSGWRNEWEQAIHFILEALQIVQRTGESLMVYPYMLIQAAKAYFHAGKIENAQPYLEQGMQQAQAQQYRQLPAIGLRLQGRILQAQQKFDAAQPCFEQSLTELIALNDAVELARTQEAYGLFYLERNQPGDNLRGQDLLATARATFDHLGVNG